MKIIAFNGEQYLVEKEDGKGCTYDLSTKKIGQDHFVISLLSKGYWEWIDPLVEIKSMKDCTKKSVKDQSGIFFKHLPGKHEQQSHGGDGSEYMDAELKSPLDRVRGFLGDNLHIEDLDTDVVRKHIRDLDQFSDTVLKSIKGAGISFYLGNKSMTGLDNNQKWKGIHPRGWSEGKTWDIVPGCYDVANHLVTLGSGDSGSVSLAGHETGHAILSSRLLSLAQVNQMGLLHSKHKKDLGNYFNQAGGAGLEEFIAESISMVIGKRTDGVVSLIDSVNVEIYSVVSKWDLFRKEEKA